MNKKQVEEHNRNFRKYLSPEKLKMINAVDQAFDEANDEFNARLQYEDRLRDFGRKLLGCPVDVSEMEEILALTKKQTPGSIFYVVPRRTQENVYLIYTVTGQLDNVTNYIKVLEKTAIDIVNSSQFTPLGFFDLIKLAFKNLFKRRK